MREREKERERAKERERVKVKSARGTMGTEIQVAAKGIGWSTHE